MHENTFAERAYLAGVTFLPRVEKKNYLIKRLRVRDNSDSKKKIIKHINVYKF